MFSNIVVGFDGSEASERALRTACKIAAKFGGKIHVSHTPRHETVAFAMGAVAGYHTVTSMPQLEEVNKAAEKMFTKARSIASDHADTPFKTHQGNGTAGEDILAVAEEVGADLIVTGRRGLGNLGALVLGSTSYHVAHHAKCAHLSVV